MTTAEQKPTAPRILSLVPAEPGWVATVYYYSPQDDGSRDVIGEERHRVLGWALVDDDGATDFQPMYVEPPGSPTCASLHNSYAPDVVTVYAHYEPGASNLTDPRTDRRSAVLETEAGPQVHVFRQAHGWRFSDPEVPEACTSNYHREQAGGPPCTDTAVWKVVEHFDHGLSIGFYCDSDLPTEHRTAEGLETREPTPRTFEDIVSADAGLSPMYRATVRAEQEDPDAPAAVIGMQAWTLLDADEQRESLPDLLQAYVEIVQHQRDGRAIR